MSEEQLVAFAAGRGDRNDLRRCAEVLTVIVSRCKNPDDVKQGSGVRLGRCTLAREILASLGANG
jgi:hypothetical protein